MPAKTSKNSWKKLYLYKTCNFVKKETPQTAQLFCRTPRVIVPTSINILRIAVVFKSLLLYCLKQKADWFYNLQLLKFWQKNGLRLNSLSLYWFLYNTKKKHNPVNIYLFKVNNRNTTKRCEICWKLTMKTPEWHQWRRSGVFIVNFEHISHLFLVFLLDN